MKIENIAILKNTPKQIRKNAGPFKRNNCKHFNCLILSVTFLTTKLFEVEIAHLPRYYISEITG